MEKGVSPIFSIILVLLIALSITALLMLFLPQATVGTFPDKSFNNSYARSRACLNIEDVNSAEQKITLKNCGKIELSNFVVYIDSRQVAYYPGKLNASDSTQITYSEIIPTGYHDVFATADLSETPVMNLSFMSSYGLCQIIISSLPYNITNNNTYYCINTAMNTNLDKTAIQFGNSTSWIIQNSTLDCRGYNLDGKGIAGTRGIYLTNSNTKNNIIKNCNVTDFECGIYLYNGPNNNVLNNITIRNNTCGIYLNSTSLNDISSSSIFNNTIDYFLNSTGTTNNFTDTNFTSSRKIYFYDTISWFNYRNSTSNNIWLRTNASAQSTITRKLTNISQTLIQFNDTSNVAVIAGYNISGLIPSSTYNVTNNSVQIAGLLNSGSNGVINFTINLPAGFENVIKINKTTGFSCGDAVLCLKFDENGGSTAYDSSSYNNYGTINVLGRNRVKNPSFESDKQYWGSGSGTWDIVTDVKYHGSKSSRFQDLTADSGDEKTGDVVVPVIGGQNITVSMFSNGSNIVQGGQGWHKAYLTGRWLNSTGYELGGTFPDMVIGDGTGSWNWKRTNKTFTAPADAVNYRFSLGLRGNSTGTLWMDAVQVEYGNNATDYIDTPWVTGKFNSALDFGGGTWNNGDYINISDSDSLHVINNFTIAVWVFNRGYVQTQYFLAKDWDYGNNMTYAFYPFGSSLSIEINLNNSGWSTGYTLPKSQWKYIATVWNGTNLSFYSFNNAGTLEYFSSTAKSLSIMNNKHRLLIGARSSGSTTSCYHLNGIIDELRIWNRSLTQAEIQTQLGYG